METEKKALYNLLRMNWLNDPSIQVEAWQVEDYRSLPMQMLSKQLEARGILLDEGSFYAYAEDAESPEELAEILLEGLMLEPMEQDHIYLLLFELWRRLLPEKLCLPIFCDELDHQIFLYDQGNPSAAESIQDAIANLQVILDESTDSGIKPTEIFEVVSLGCANNLETFLYDYIAEQIDSENIAYAAELADGLGPYLKGSRWFSLLQIRILDTNDPDAAQDQLRKLVQKVVKDKDLSFNLEVLSFIVQGGEKGEFNKLVRKTIPLLETEEDFLDLLAICTDFYRVIDEDERERNVQRLIDHREANQPDSTILPDDEDITKLLKIIR
jgi:hypothetical protein